MPNPITTTLLAFAGIATSMSAEVGVALASLAVVLETSLFVSTLRD